MAGTLTLRALRLVCLICLAWATGSAWRADAADKPDFEAATRPPDRDYPPEPTINGMTPKETELKVRALWPTIVFEKDGKPVNYVVKLDTEEGDIEVEFFPKDAPNHARSFICLAKAGFYNGTVFHRCIKTFMIQGGCPFGTGIGGPGYNLKGEFNKRPHERGILSAARGPDRDSAGSQFFLLVAKKPHLDDPENPYTVFGKVTKGMDVVDKIVAKPTKPTDRRQQTPVKPVKIRKATVTVKS